MELFPFLIFRTESGNAEFAQWKTGTGEMAVALFQSKAEAEGFIIQAGLEPSWTAFQPPLPLLQSILKALLQGGIQFAVLNPNASNTRTLFSLEDVVKGSESWFQRQS